MKKTLALALVLAAAGGLAGCLGEGDGGGSVPHLASAWPHLDGTAWSYAMQVRLWDTAPFGWDGDSLPTMEALRADLRHAVTAPPVQETSYIYNLAFSGTVTTRSGVVAQNLIGFAEPVDGSGALATPSLEQTLRRRLALIPRDPGGDGGAPPTAAAAVPFGPHPTLLAGHAFAWEDSGYYGYGDVDSDHSWVHLEHSLRSGQAFSLPLVPSLQEDVWLYGRVWSVGPRAVGGVTYENAVDCMYVVDLGPSTLTDENGDPLGTVRNLVYGIVVYAPDVGPVAVFERSCGMTRTAYEPTGVVFASETRCVLEDRTLPD